MRTPNETWPLSPRDRYLNDPVFHNLVDLLQHMLEENDSRTWTPTELREAVMLAAVMYEQHRIRPLMIDRNGEYISGPHVKTNPCEHNNFDEYFNRCDDCGFSPEQSNPVQE